MSNFMDKLSRYFMFSSKEIFGIFIAILVCGLIFSADSWGYTASSDAVDTNSKWVNVISQDEDQLTVVDYAFGFKNMLLSLLFAAITILIHHSVQRIVGIGVGYKPEHKLSKGMLLAGIVLAIVSNGAVKFLAPVGMMLYHLTGQRLGEYRYGLNYWTLGLVGLLGPISAIFLAIIFKVLFTLNPGNTILYSAMVFNLWFAASNLLPFPPLDGSHMFFASRWFYVFAVAGLGAIIILLLLVNALLAVILGFIIGLGIFIGSYMLTK